MCVRNTDKRSISFMMLVAKVGILYSKLYMKQFYFYCSNELRNMLEPHDANHMMRHNQIPPVVSGGTTTVCCTLGPRLCCSYWPTPPKPTIYSTTFAPFPTCTRRPWTLSRILDIYWPLEGVTIRIPINSLLFTPLNHMESRRCKCPALPFGLIVTLTSSWHKIIWGKITQLQDPQLCSNLLPNMVGIICVPSKFTLYNW